MTHTRLSPDIRTEQLLDAALALAAASGLRTMTRDALAEAAGVSPGLISARLGTMDAMRRSVMRAAVTQGCIPVVAEGLALRDKHALRADEALRAACAAWVARA